VSGPRICLGAIAGAHGVRGEFKIKTFTQSPNGVAAYGPVKTEDNQRELTLHVIRTLKPDVVLVRALEIKSREEAESFKGVRLFVDRASLPQPDEDEFYLEDLVGLTAVDSLGETLGSVSAVYDFGAGDLIEIKLKAPRKGVHLIPFTKQNCPEINLSCGTMTLQSGLIDATEN